MKKFTYINNTLLTSMAISLIGMAATSANAMSFFNAAEQEAAASAKMVIEAIEAPSVAPEPVAVELPDRFNTIIGNFETDLDVKHYTFTAVRGQKVFISEIHPAGGRSKFKMEYRIDNVWRPVATFSPLIIPGLKPDQPVHIRVLKNTPQALTPNDKYHFEFGSVPYITHHQVTGDAEQLAIRFPTSKFARKMSWYANTKDSTGQPIEGVKVSLVLNMDKKSTTRTIVSAKMSNASGFVGAEVNLGSCVGKERTDPFVGVFDFKTKWQVTYNTGDWYITPGSHIEGGIGSKEGHKVPLTHICTQKIVR